MITSKTSHGKIPRSLSAEQLKRLSFLCGLPLSGRKQELITRLAAAARNSHIPQTSQTGAEPVILSIDLGIKNLAFSLLTPIPSSQKDKIKAATKSKEQLQDVDNQPPFLYTSPPAISLHAWQRLSILDGPAGKPARSLDQGLLDVDASSDVFTPSVLAKTANAFLQETVLRFHPLPTHVLIERQRWRTGGGSAILEWTVRVNTLEAMLHASLRTLRDVGAWKGDVTSIQPGRVGPFFLDADKLDALPTMELDKEVEIEVPSRIKRTSGAESKKLKIDLLGRWLDQGDDIVRPGNVDVGHMLDAYRDALKPTRRRKSKRVLGEEDGTTGKHITLDRKLDDLTDSLMQGMVWLRWQENMALLGVEGGVDQLLGGNTQT